MIKTVASKGVYSLADLAEIQSAYLSCNANHDPNVHALSEHTREHLGKIVGKISAYREAQGHDPESSSTNEARIIVVDQAIPDLVYNGLTLVLDSSLALPEAPEVKRGHLDTDITAATRLDALVDKHKNAISATTKTLRSDTAQAADLVAAAEDAVIAKGNKQKTRLVGMQAISLAALLASKEEYGFFSLEIAYLKRLQDLAVRNDTEKETVRAVTGLGIGLKWAFIKT